MMIDSFEEIKHISDDEIMIHTKQGNLIITGKKLVVEAFHKEEILIQGVFMNIKLPYER